jgi:hypothetical protein
MTRATSPGPACAGSGSPAIRWSVSSWEVTDQGADGGGHTKTARGPASEPSWDSACGFGRPGVHPVSSVQLWCGLAQVPNLRCEPEKVVETRRLELLTSSLQRRCSTN